MAVQLILLIPMRSILFDERTCVIYKTNDLKRQFYTLHCYIKRNLILVNNFNKKSWISYYV